MRSGHNFAHAMTAELSWHVQNCDLIQSLGSKQEQKQILQILNYKLINASWNGPEDGPDVMAEVISSYLDIILPDFSNYYQ